MTVFITGGVRSGKSALGQKITLQLSDGLHYYVATMIPVDADDRERIRLHLLDRKDLGFQTIEQGRDIAGCLVNADPNGTFLVDSVTALMMNELFPPEKSYALDENAPQRVEHGLKTLIKSAKHVVFVSDYLFSDALRYDTTTEAYRRGLGEVHQILARLCDTVVEVSSGQITIHKGELPQ